MPKTKTVVATALTAGITTIAIVATTLIPSTYSTASAEYVVNFDEGEYNTWDGTTYTFDWYRNPSTNEDGITEYVISSASDLAGLAVLTNDLSSSEWDSVTSNVSDTQYISQVESFANSVIRLDTDIDLADMDWLPISYPWNTPNLTASYEFINTAGETVRYNAIDYITEDDTVDPWVGDENGDPISTRYWEYPESELRFRDLINTITFDGLHNLIDTSISNDTTWDELMRDSVDNVWNGMLGDGTTRLSYIWGLKTIDNDLGPDPYTFDRYSALDPLAAVELEELNLKQNIMVPYTFKSIKGFTSNPGFEGTFNGDGHNIKGLTPKTPWTDDATERLATYDPIAKGLFGILAEDGRIENLNVKGSYDNEIVSYSALLCAWNYGTIDKCYVEGDMNQALIEMIYPVNRDYGPNGTSTYVLADAAGTVMPVGNSGFLTSQNYGTISNCYTVGSVIQAFRQFGFMASTNYGIIDSCVNRATLTAAPVSTDFHTDEWSNSTNETFTTVRKIATSGKLTHDIPLPTVDDPTILQPKYSSFIEMNSPNVLAGDYRLISFTSAGVSLCHGDAVVTNVDDYSFWIPKLYNTDENESIAANHLYGQYVMTVAGGIAGINEGKIINCVNKGEIHTLSNMPCAGAFSVYTPDKTLADFDDVYSYIRPQNSYGIFATSNTSLDIAAGVTGVNFGNLIRVTNAADIVAAFSSFTDNSSLGFMPIMITENGYYQNDVMYNGEPYLWGLRWWVTEDNPNAGLFGAAEESGITSAVFNRNMPYPFYDSSDFTHNCFTAGISGYNMGTIATAENTGAAEYYVCVCSLADEEHSNPSISNIENTSTQTLAYTAVNTDFDNIDTTERMIQDEILQTGDYEVSLSNINVIDAEDTCRYGSAEVDQPLRLVSLACNISGENRDKMYLDAVASKLALAHEIQGVTFENVYVENHLAKTLNDTIFKNMYLTYSGEEYALASSINSSTFENVAIVSDGFNSLTAADECSLYGGVFDSKFKNLTINCISPVTGDVGNALLGKFQNCELTDIEVFGNNTGIWATDCEITNMIAQGFLESTFVSALGEEYVYKFSNCTCTDMYLESDTDFEWKAPMIVGKLQNIPGFLQASGGTNTFSRCAVVTPDGALSYPTFNSTIVEDEELPDAKLVYVKDASKNGGLAYYLDKGYSSDRTFDYTVAKNDVRNYGDYLPASVEMFLTDEQINKIKAEVALPIYTRKKISADEPSFYRVSVPYVGLGAGEVKVSLERDNQVQSTEAEGLAFPKTDLFTVPGDTIDFDVVAHDGFELNGLTWVTGTETIELKSTSPNTEAYTFESATAPAEDVQILANWADIWAIELSDDCTDWLVLESSASGAAVGRTINLRMTVLNDEYAVGSLYYYPYKKQGTNDWVLDTSEKYLIDLATASFEMPNASIRIYAEAIGNTAEMLDIVIAGTHGLIDGNGSVTVQLDNSIDITNLCIDNVQLSEGATISPAIDVPQNFSSPVEYTVKSSSGIEKKYIVNVISTTDGDISLFEFKGRMGVIDPEAGTITVTLPEGEDVSSVTPYIVWSGTAITPDVTAPQDFTQTIAYTVTASNGSTKTYTIVLDFVTYDSAIQTLTLKMGDMTLPYEVDDTRGVITVTYPYGYDVTEVQLVDFNYEGESANIARGEYLNLTKTNRILIVNEHGATKDYRLVAIEAKNPAKKITQFVIFGVEGIIDEEAATITLNIPKKYDVTAIAPDIISFIGASVEDASVTRDFTQPVEYTIRSYTGETKTYTVIVNRI